MNRAIRATNAVALDVCAKVAGKTLWAAMEKSGR